MNVEAIYDVLVEECGAWDSPDHREAFAVLFPGCVEYRFQGSLGFGGKVWANRGSVYVNCYLEDLTPERAEAIRRANARLAVPYTEGDEG